MKTMFLHGLESGPHGSKFKALEKHFEVVSPDCSGVFLVEPRIKTVLEHLHEPTLLVGSSFGGLVAVLIAHRHPELVSGLVLCAPALHWVEAEEVKTLSCPVKVLHGVEDDVVPVEASREFCERFGWDLVEVHDGHRLSESLDEIVELAQSFR